MDIELPKLIATSVVRGTQQGESHGGVYTIDFGQHEVVQHVDWNTSGIDFEGRGADRGLRGIEFHEDAVYIAASDELFRYGRDFKIQASYRNRYLKHCHEICRRDQTILLTSTGFDSLLAFDLAQGEYVWGFHLQRPYDEWGGHTFDPRTNKGPRPVNEFHINMVHVDRSGIFMSGLHTRALLHLDSRMAVTEVCSLPAGAHNARPYRNGILFNDTETDCVRYAGSQRRERRVQDRHLRRQRDRVRRHRRFQGRPSGLRSGSLPNRRALRGRGLVAVDSQPLRLRSQSKGRLCQSDQGHPQRNPWPRGLAFRLIEVCKEERSRARAEARLRQRFPHQGGVATARSLRRGPMKKTLARHPVAKSSRPGL